MRWKLAFVLFLVLGCQNENPKEKNSSDGKSQESTGAVFTKIDPSNSGVEFNNEIKETGELNYFNYTYLYNGGGVGIGDINNDGLSDIYFTSTQGKDKLYLNKGDFQFEDISASSGIDTYGGCKTGVTFTDVNNDGWIDIYVCRSGWFSEASDRTNLLFINRKNNTFIEAAKAFGLADGSRSIQSVFFDQDKDGDLDLYISSHPAVFRQSMDKVVQKTNNASMVESDRFYRNNGNGTFTEATQQANMVNHGYGLGIVAADLNDDGWTDVYVSNDFQPRDNYYVNQKNGSFKESLREYFPHCSYFSMGVDVVDINNDGNLDLFTGEMLSEDNTRQKTNMAPMDPEKFQYLIDNGQHYQYMRNCFQINNGNGHFSDIADYAGISKTDWSWSCLFGDYDNDGDNDLLVVNGWLKDTQDKDFSNKANAAAAKNNNQLSFEVTSSFLNSTPLTNYAFEYEGDYRFRKVSSEWGFNETGHSNGMAYGDLNNDGTLDVVINNMNGVASIYKNNSKGKYLRLKLKGQVRNSMGLNSKITLETNKGKQYKEHQVTRGFQSCSEALVHFGLADDEVIENIKIVWYDDKEQNTGPIESNQVVTIDYKGAKKSKVKKEQKRTLLYEARNGEQINFTHTEQGYNDFDVQVLLPHKLSQLGPALSTADVNGDGLEDVYVGGARSQAGQLFLQTKGGFEPSSSSTWENDKNHEDVAAEFFDADNDGDIDLYVVSGSYEFQNNSKDLSDRLYINDGKGLYTRAKASLRGTEFSGGCVAASDYDGDGDQDLFVGARVIPGRYPQAPRSVLLENNQGEFTSVSDGNAAAAIQTAMVSSAIWSDYDKDGDPDLITVGEWSNINFYNNNDGVLSLQELVTGKQVGWWNIIKACDLDNDGDDDYIIGNLGENYKYSASAERPFEVYAGDLDKNGTEDIILGYYSGEDLYPVRGFQCSSEQLPSLKNKFGSYSAFGAANIFDVYGPALNKALHLKANTFSSVVMWNEPTGMKIQRLPTEAQFFPIQDVITKDLDGDGDKDLILAGNWFVSEVETPRADAGTGLVLLNEGSQSFKVLSSSESGFFTKGDVRRMAILKSAKRSLVLVANNNAAMQTFVIPDVAEN